MAGPRIAYVCADRGVPIGGHKGSSTHVTELVRALQARGAEVRIIAARSEADGLPAPVEDLGAERATRQARQALFADARGPRAEARAAEAFGVLLNQPLGRALERLYRRWPFDAVYERYSLWGVAAASFARAAGLPHLLEVNAPLREEQRRYRALENPALAASIEAFVLRGASHVLVQSEALRPYVVRHGAEARRVHVLPNAADPARFAPRPVRAAGDPFVIGFLGTLKPWHGLDQLLRAVRQLHRRWDGYRLLIAGDGPLRPELERTVRASGLRDVTTFTGPLAHAEVPAALARMDVGVAPYPRLAGFYFSPLKVFEYLAAGVPVVASDIGQLGEVLDDNRTALLHRPGSVGDLVEAIDRLRRQPARAAALARAGRSLVRRRYTWSHNAARVLRLVAAATRRGARRRVA